VASLLKALVVALKEGVVYVAGSAGHLLAAAGHKVTESVQALLRGVAETLFRAVLSQVLQWLASLIKKPAKAGQEQGAQPAQQAQQPGQPAAATEPSQAA
jgi:hypothetical protein